MTLESQLDRLASDVRFGDPPDVAGRVALELPPRSRRQTRRFWLPVAVAAAIALLLVIAIPQSRETVARWLNFGGIRIEWVERRTGSHDVPIDSALIVGEPVSASSVVGLLALPGQEPHAIYRRTDAGMVDTVSFVYAPDEFFPEIGNSGVGALLMQTDAEVDFYPFVKHALRTEQGSRFVVVGSVEGYWVATGELVSVPYDPDGTYGLDLVTRPTGNVLIWQVDGITYRLETNLSRQEAVTLAESLVPFREPE